MRLKRNDIILSVNICILILAPLIDRHFLVFYLQIKGLIQLSLMIICLDDSCDNS